MRFGLDMPILLLLIVLSKAHSGNKTSFILLTPHPRLFYQFQWKQICLLPSLRSQEEDLLPLKRMDMIILFDHIMLMVLMTSMIITLILKFLPLMILSNQDS